MKYTSQKLNDIFQILQTNSDTGLTDEKVSEIQKVKGLNVFEEEKKETVFQKFIHHMRDFTVIILLVAGSIALYSAIWGDGQKGPADAIVIFSIVIINVTLYVILAYASVVNIFNVRSFSKSLFTIGFTSNRLLFGGICLSFSLIAVTVLVPGVREVFYCVPISMNHWYIVIGMAVTPFFAVELKKLLIRKKLTARTA